MDNLKEIIELVGKKILIKEDSFDEQTKNGLKFLKKDENKTIGTVLLNNDASSDYIIGQKVVYPNFAGVKVEIDGNQYKTLETREVFFTYDNGVIEAKNNFVVIKPKVKTDNRRLKVVKSQEESNTEGVITSVAKGVNIREGVGAVFSRYSGFTIDVNGENHVVLSEEEIFFIFIKN
jgi:co-chaperonin GroES (HSP10)